MVHLCLASYNLRRTAAEIVISNYRHLRVREREVANVRNPIKPNSAKIYTNGSAKPHARNTKARTGGWKRWRC